MLKLDFEKAFDLIEHSLSLDMLRAKGFPDKWLLWITDLIGSATSSVLLNGTSGKEFKCKRGVRQGDPLSPLLFSIIAYLIQCVINHEYDMGNLHPTFPQDSNIPFPVVQYVDDTILVMQANEEQLILLKETLHKVTLSSGLKVNYHKSCLVPINISQEQAGSLASAFGCSVGTFPLLTWVFP